MKKLLSILFISTLLFTACEGDQGPQGNDGGLIVSSAFEIEVDFNNANGYEAFEPYGFDVFPSDITLVYILWETANGEDIWRLTPQNVEFESGTLIYNYDFTQNDVRLFLDGSIDFTTLDASYTQNQIFRVVVVPADNVGRLNNVDVSNLESVIQFGQIKSFNKK